MAHHSEVKYLWPVAAKQILEGLIARGLSASMIASEMPVVGGRRPTRNAVIGKINRVGLRLQSRANVRGQPAEKTRIRIRKNKEVTKTEKPPIVALPKVEHIEKRKSTGEPQGPLDMKEHRAPEGIVPPLENPEHVGLNALDALKPGSCRYPIGFPKEPDFRFCTANVVEINKCQKSYCAWHYALTHGPSRPKKTSTMRSYKGIPRGGR